MIEQSRTRETKDETQINHLNSKIWCRIGQSKIHGVGIIAIRTIPKGTDIDHSGDYYSIQTKNFKQIKKEIRNLILDRTLFDNKEDEISFHCPNHDAKLQAFMNHSKTPNFNGWETTKQIKKGEEVTKDFTKIFGERKTAHKLSLNHIKNFTN